MTNNIDEKTIIDEIDGVLDDLIASYEAMVLYMTMKHFIMLIKCFLTSVLNLN